MPVVCLLVAAGSAFAQHGVDAGSMYACIHAIAPMVGSSTDARTQLTQTAAQMNTLLSAVDGVFTEYMR